jgi:hypothetical protein
MSRRLRLGVTLGTLVAVGLVVVTAAVVLDRRAKRRATTLQLNRVANEILYITGRAGDRRGVTDVEFALEILTTPWKGGAHTIAGAGCQDAWGHPLRFEWRRSHADRKCFCFAIWSCGPDGIDQRGEGDDILVSRQRDDQPEYPDALNELSPAGGEVR